MDKLKIRAEIQEAFNDEKFSLDKRLSILNKSIIIYKIMFFLTKDVVIFTYSFIPTLIAILYFLLTSNTNLAIFASVIFLVSHFLIYKFVFKMWLFRDSESINEEAYYTLGVLKEIKENQFK
jgi:hypothetical protein